MTAPPSLTDLVLQATPEQRAELRAALDAAEPTKEQREAAITSLREARKERS